MGHSTGGLVTALCGRPGARAASTALVLNSPWLDLQGSALVRAIGAPVIDALGARSPTSVLRAADPGHYARVLHRSLEGEWDYDLDLKLYARPARSGSAGCGPSCRASARSPAGLGIEVPVLVLASARTSFARRWSEDLRVVDSVLDVEQIAARAVRLGRHVTVVRVEEGLHDLVLSAARGARAGVRRDRAASPGRTSGPAARPDPSASRRAPRPDAARRGREPRPEARARSQPHGGRTWCRHHTTAG